MATIITPNYLPQMATVRHKVFAPGAVDKHKKGEVIREEFDGDYLLSRSKLVDIVDEIEATVNLTEADIIVSGGKGLGKAEN